MKQARLSAREAIGTGYEQKLQRLIAEGRFIHPLDGDRPSFADLAHALARWGWLGRAPLIKSEVSELLSWLNNVWGMIQGLGSRATVCYSVTVVLI